MFPSRIVSIKKWHICTFFIGDAFDFSKHINNKDIPRVYSVWANIQKQLARDNCKFRYGDVQKGARAREYENAIEWLCLAGLPEICSKTMSR